MIIEVEKVPQNPPQTAPPKNTLLTHVKGPDGWQRLDYHRLITKITRVVYLGKCDQDGDCFAIYHRGFISFAKGELNNGVFKD